MFDCKDAIEQKKIEQNQINYKRVKNSSNNSRSASSDDIYINCGDKKKDVYKFKKGKIQSSSSSNHSNQNMQSIYGNLSSTSKPQNKN
jgi:hypothetical protein